MFSMFAPQWPPQKGSIHMLENVGQQRSFGASKQSMHKNRKLRKRRFW